MTTTPPQRPAWAPLASMALTEAVLGNNKTASRAMQELHDEHGPEAVPGVMIAWIDTLLAHCPLPPGQLASFLFRREGSTEITTADDVPPHVAWAGRLIVARALNDYAQAVALVNSIPTDEDYSRNVSALLSTIAANLRMAGWADEIRRQRGTT
jgi:hypothetical protein